MKTIFKFEVSSMAEKGQYKTRQRDEILSYLRSIPGEHVTAGDICAHFRERDRAIGTATVYRQLDKLVSEGLLNKYFIDESTGACFEYVDSRDHRQGGPCYHCKCEKCGRLIHLGCEELSHIQRHLEEEHGFTLDPLRTVFYGVCQDCRAAGEGL